MIINRSVGFCNMEDIWNKYREATLWAHFSSLISNTLLQLLLLLHSCYKYTSKPQKYSVLTLNVKVSVSFCDISCWIASTFWELLAVLSAVNRSTLQRHQTHDTTAVNTRNTRLAAASLSNSIWCIKYYELCHTVCCMLKKLLYCMRYSSFWPSTNPVQAVPVGAQDVCG